MPTNLARLALITQLAFVGLLERARSVRNDRGATAVEYGLLVALIAAVIVGAVMLFGDKITQIFDGTTAKIPTPSGSATVTPAG